ncbi:MAG: hypothetical protein ABI629_08800 [bacterium]
MSDHPPRLLAEMRAIADSLVDQLRPFCDRIEIAGSIRRSKPECRDVELVCVPRLGITRAPGEMFDRSGINLLDHFVHEQLVAGGVDRLVAWTTRPDVNGRAAVGVRYKRLAVGDIPLDLFSVLRPASWGVLFLIRTGPAEFSQRMVTQRTKGGALPDDCQVRDGAVWRGSKRVAVQDEAAFFALCGMGFVEPEARR